MSGSRALFKSLTLIEAHVNTHSNKDDERLHKYEKERERENKRARKTRVWLELHQICLLYSDRTKNAALARYDETQA